MKLTQLLSPDLIKVGVADSGKENLIRQLVEVIADNGLLSDAEQAYQDVMTRELQQSTGLEYGIAIPHGKSAAVSELVGALGVSEEGIEFNSMDGKPSHLFFLLIAPPTMSGPHVRALANIAKLTQNINFRKKLIAARNSQEAYQIIKEAEKDIV